MDKLRALVDYDDDDDKQSTKDETNEQNKIINAHKLIKKKRESNELLKKTEENHIKDADCKDRLNKNQNNRDDKKTSRRHSKEISGLPNDENPSNRDDKGDDSRSYKEKKSSHRSSNRSARRSQSRSRSSERKRKITQDDKRESHRSARFTSDSTRDRRDRGTYRDHHSSKESGRSSQRSDRGRDFRDSRGPSRDCRNSNLDYRERNSRYESSSSKIDHDTRRDTRENNSQRRENIEAKFNLSFESLASSMTMNTSSGPNDTNCIQNNQLESSASPSVSTPLLPTSSTSQLSLPKYYKPSTFNAAKFAAQEEKKKLLWGSNKKECSQPNKSSKVWEGLQFSGAQGTQMAEKFLKLMGSKSSGQNQSNTEDSSLLKYQETLFNDLDKQYSAARMSTHTHRGIGLGFSSYSAPKPDT